jgi:ferrochelatase
VKRVIVLVAHGTVKNLDDLPEFLSRIRHGRSAPDSLILEMKARYEAVGGSPHLEETLAQALALQESIGLETRTAMRLWHPTVAEVTADLGPADEVILVPLAPYSVAVYERAARAELSQRSDAPALHCVGPWGKGAELIDAQVASIASLLAKLPAERTEVILTAHSLPQAVIDAGDRYASEFESAAALVATALGGSDFSVHSSSRQGASPEA